MTGKQNIEQMERRRYPAQPGVGIGVVLWRDDKVLLVKRANAPMQGQWALPGGRQHLGETIMEGAVREVREETGLDCKPLGVITALDVIVKDDNGKVEYHYTLIDVLAEALDGEAKAADDASDVRWAGVDEIEGLCEWPEVARVVRLGMLQRVL